MRISGYKANHPHQQHASSSSLGGRAAFPQAATVRDMRISGDNANHPCQRQDSSSSLGGRAALPQAAAVGDMRISGYNANHPCQQQASSSSLGGPAALPEAAAVRDRPMTEAATLGSILDSTPEGKHMFRTITSSHAQAVNHLLCANVPIISVTAAATHADHQKFEEIATQKYGGAPAKYEEVVWFAGVNKLHPFEWISRDELGPAQRIYEISSPHFKKPGIWESYEFKEILLQAKMQLKFHRNFLDAMSISTYNATAQKAHRLVVYWGATVGQWWQVMFEAKDIVDWQSVLKSLDYIYAQDLESQGDVLLAITHVLEPDFSIAQ